MNGERPSDPAEGRGGTGLDRPRYATPQDYLRVIRRRKLLIVAFVIVGTAAGLIISLLQSKTYEATTHLQFNDVNQQLNFLPGNSTPAVQSPLVFSAQSAEFVKSPAVTDEVARLLTPNPRSGKGGAKQASGAKPAPPYSTSDLSSAVSTNVATQTGLVDVTVTWSSADLAAKIANTYAVASRRLKEQDTRRQLGDTLKSLEAQLKTAKAARTIPDVPTPTETQLQSDIAQVSTLQKVARPVQVTSPAEPPPSQSSPAPKRNTVIGLVLGLVFGLIAAFVRDSLDRRLHGSQEIRDALGMPVLGKVSESALGYAGLARNGQESIPDADFEGFRALRMNLAALGADPPVRSVLVTSGLPEEGKSTVSMSLASAAAIAGQRVLLVECDLRRPAFARRMRIARRPGLTDYLLGSAGPQEILQTVELGPPAGANGAVSSEPTAATLVCIAAGTPVSNPAEILITPRFQSFLAKVTKAYDLVVLDAGPLLAVVDPLEVVPHVDAVLVCVRARKTTREEARATKTALTTVISRPAGVVITGIRPGDPDSYDYYYGSY